MSDFNAGIVEEFRANHGKVGGPFEGAPLLLLHHNGRRSGKPYVSPMMYLPDENDPATVYVFASKAGAPTDPEWYHNVTMAGWAQVEIGDEKHDVTVRDLTGTERSERYAEQAARYPGFAEYAQKTEGIRTIPVLALTRV